MEGVVPDGLHWKVYPAATTADNVTVAGNVQTPAGPEIRAIGSGLIATDVCVLAVQPFASIILSVTLYVPANAYVTDGFCKAEPEGVPPVNDQEYVVPPEPKKFNNAPWQAGDATEIPATGFGLMVTTYATVVSMQGD